MISHKCMFAANQNLTDFGGIPDGIAAFDVLRRHGTVSEAMMYAFDILELDGEDPAPCHWSAARGTWAKLVGRRRLA